MVMGRGMESVFHHHFGFRKALVHVPFANLNMLEQVAIGVNSPCLRLTRLDSIGNYWQEFIFGFDQVKGLGRNLARLRRHNRYRITNVAHRLADPNQRRPVENNQPMVVLAGDILSGQNRGNARQRLALLISNRRKIPAGIIARLTRA